MSKKGSGGKNASKSSTMTKEAASRIQRASDKNLNSNQAKVTFPNVLRVLLTNVRPNSSFLQKT